ncbi:alpha/beta hydrolase family protein [Kitasatospora camelliae]|uniref:Alpha/beta hydrolase n=1 Tax=Kitasatospora camelliae TaxID=3156397 RepID=A0AAU8JQS4_9ACTN
MTTLRRGAAVGALVLALAVPSAASATAAPLSGSATAEVVREAAGVRLALPAPTGRYAVGRDTLHLVDGSRPDPWVPSAGARELMLSLFYPARPGTGRPAPYMSTEEARLLLADRVEGGEALAGTVAATRTAARQDARPAAGRYPLVVLSPGFTVPRQTLTHLAEELASRGYVVAAVDHAYETVGTAFPGGRMLTCAACPQVEAGGYRAVSDGRAADVSFVLDRLTGRHPAWRYARLIDPSRIGMAGHSIGGAATAAAMAADRRVGAGVNLDGSFATPVPGGGLGGRPFLMLGAPRAVPGGDPSWDAAWQRLDGWKRWLTVDGSGHFTATDLPVLGGRLGMIDPAEPLSGPRSAEITRAYVGAFFDLHLGGLPQPILDAPTPADPEVRFHRP